MDIVKVNFHTITSCLKGNEEKWERTLTQQ